MAAMSRSTFLTTTSSFETSESPSLPATGNGSSDHGRAPRFHHRLMPTISASSRSNETLPVVVVQSSTTTSDSTTMIKTNTTQHKSVVRLNPKSKRNTRDKRRATGIRPDEVLSADASHDTSFHNDDEDDNTPPHSPFMTLTSTEPSDPHDRHRPNSPKPVFKVSRVQPTFDDNIRHSFDKLNISRTDPFVLSSAAAPTATMFQPAEFIVRRQTSADDPSAIKCRQLEERLRALEALVYDKDAIIHDLQRKLDKTTRELSDAEQQIYVLQRDKLTLIKALTSMESNSAGAAEHGTSTVRTGFISRN